MTKFVISPGYGSGFTGTFEQRFDPVLVETLEKIQTIQYNVKAGLEKHKHLCDLHDLVVARLVQLDIEMSREQARTLALTDVASGVRFLIEEYDGSEYVITENDLLFVAP